MEKLLDTKVMIIFYLFIVRIRPHVSQVIANFDLYVISSIVTSYNLLSFLAY
jgi:hypothetical protein